MQERQRRHESKRCLGAVELNADRTVETINLVLGHRVAAAVRDATLFERAEPACRETGVRQAARGGAGRGTPATSSVLLNRAQTPGNGHGNGDCMMTGAEPAAAAAPCREQLPGMATGFGAGWGAAASLLKHVANICYAKATFKLNVTGGGADHSDSPYICTYVC